MKFPGMQALSLKEIEGNLGLAIVESDLLDKDKLNEEEYKQVLEYNKHDVLATYELYKQVREQIECKEELINEFKLPKSCFNDTYVAIARKILNAKLIKQEESFIYNKPSCINLEHKDIEDIYNGVEFKLDTNVKVEKQINGLDITFGVGGVHGTKDNFSYKYENDNVYAYQSDGCGIVYKQSCSCHDSCHDDGKKQYKQDRLCACRCASADISGPILLLLLLI